MLQSKLNLFIASVANQNKLAMNHLQKKFPKRYEHIKALIQKSSVFEDLCGDYEEICTWLTSQNRIEIHTEQELNHAREIIRDLEQDIIKTLKQEVG